MKALHFFFFFFFGNPCFACNEKVHSKGTEIMAKIFAAGTFTLALALSVSIA